MCSGVAFIPVVFIKYAYHYKFIYTHCHDFKKTNYYAQHRHLDIFVHLGIYTGMKSALSVDK